MEPGLDAVRRLFDVLYNGRATNRDRWRVRIQPAPALQQEFGTRLNQSAFFINQSSTWSIQVNGDDDVDAGAFSQLAPFPQLVSNSTAVNVSTTAIATIFGIPMYPNVTLFPLKEHAAQLMIGLNITENGHHEHPTLNYWALLVILIILAGVVGNALCIIAVLTDKRLQQPTNFFLVSLAVADLLVSMLVMPLGMWNELYGYWSFGFYPCLFYVLMDVLCCSASILHMALISVDRYLGIKDPLKRTNTKKIRALKISAIWIVSLLISFPMIPWSFMNPHYILPEQDLCVISNAYIMIYGSVVAFFIPQITMCVMMFLTVRLLKQQAAWSAGKRAATRRTECLKPRSNSHTLLSSTPTRIHLNGNHHPNMRLREESSSDATGDETASPSSGSRQQTIRKVTDAMSLFRKNRRKMKARNIDSEKKATKVLTIVFTLFSICWMPFFIFNLIHGVCLTIEKDDCVADVLFHISLWLGWASSIVNPMVYTVVNPNFRQAFLYLLSGGKLGKSCRRQLYLSVQTCRERSGAPCSPTANNGVQKGTRLKPSATTESTWNSTFLSALELNNETPV